jgi:hypothetical protein
MQAAISSQLGSAARIERCVCDSWWKVPQAMVKVDTESENSRCVDMHAIETVEAPAAPPSSKELFRRANIDSQWIRRGGGGCGF